MKTLDGGPQRRFSAARLVLCVILVAATTVGLSAPVRACGQTTHRLIVERAYGDPYRSSYPGLATLLETYPGAVASGAVFPDWGYASAFKRNDGSYNVYSDNAHKDDYTDAFLAYLQSSLFPPYSEDDLKTIAFLFGLISHQLEDPAFHGGFIPVAQEIDRSDHTEVEMGVDAFTAVVYSDYIDFWFPEEAILAAYGAVGVSDLTATKLHHELHSDGFCWEHVWDISYKAIVNGYQDAGHVSLLYYVGRLPWTFSNFYIYPNGGVRNLVQLTADAWQQRWDQLKPVTTIGLSPTQPDGSNGWYRQPVIVTLGAAAYLNGQIDTWYSLDGGAYQLYTGPFTISSEGSTSISFYSVDSMENAEAVQNLTLNIDLTSPVVDVTVDQSRYTRMEPLSVHISGYDPQPGSGMASLTAEFDGQPVTDGQNIDLFWLALGNYTLAARGEDVAGWVTEASQSIELYATNESLQETLDRLCEESYITIGDICNELSVKLDAALAARDRGNLKAAVQVLNAFQNAVQAQAGKAIPDQAASLLLMDSDYVIQELSR